MNYLKHILFVLLLTNTLTHTMAQNIAPQYEVATWKGFANAAITYTFDDNCAKQSSVAIPIFDQYDFQATFYPVIAWDPEWHEFQKAAQMGHEIASHTVNHRNFAELSPEEQDEELRLSQEIINEKIPKKKCITHAYPFCIPADEKLTQKYYIGARHCQGNIEKSTPDNFYNISSIICGPAGEVKTANDFINKARQAVKTNGWCIYLLHGIDDDGGYSPVQSDDLKNSLDFFDKNRNEYWLATFVDVLIYIKQRDNANINEIEKTDSTFVFELSDTLNNLIYNTSLTINREIPKSWKNVKVIQGKTELAGKVYSKNSKNYIEFDATPDQGTIKIINIISSRSSDYIKDEKNYKIAPDPLSSYS